MFVYRTRVRERREGVKAQVGCVIFVEVSVFMCGF